MHLSQILSLLTSVCITLSHLRLSLCLFYNTWRNFSPQSWFKTLCVSFGSLQRYSCLSSFGASILNQCFTEYHPTLRKNKALLLTFLIQSYLSLSCLYPYLNPEFSLWELIRVTPVKARALYSLLVCLGSLQCTRSPYVPLQAVNNILSNNMRGGSQMGLFTATRWKPPITFTIRFFSFEWELWGSY